MSAVVGAAVLMTGLILPLVSGNRSAVSWVEHTQQVIAATDELLLSAADIETGLRGFLLTGDDTFVEPYNRGSEQVRRQLLGLRDLTADNPRQQNNLRSLGDLLRDWKAVADETIALARAGNVNRALDIVRGGSGKHLTDEIRRIAGNMIAEERRLLQERRDRAEQSTRSSAQVFVALGILVSLLTIVLAVMAAGVARRARAAAAERQRMLDIVNLAAVMVRDLDGNIRFWSEGCSRLYGWTADQALGRPTRTLLQTVFPVPFAEIEAALLRDGAWNGELRQSTREGAEVVVSARKILHNYADGRGLAVVENMTDVTTLRQAEAALHDSEIRLRLCIDNAPASIAMFDTDMRYLAVSRRFITDYRLEDEIPATLIGRSHYELFPDIPERRRAVHRRVLAGEALSADAEPFRRTDGRTDWVRWEMVPWRHSDGTIGGALLFSENLTDRKIAEVALRDSEARLRLVQQVGGVAYSDRAFSDTSILVSEEFARLYGLPSTETHISTADWIATIHPEDRERLVAERKSVLEGGSTLSAQFRICRPDGEVRWIEMRAEIFFGPNGQPLRVITAQQDITDIVAARETLAVRQQELERRVTERTGALSEAQARFRDIFDAQFEHISLLAHDGTILEMNRTALDARGLTREEAIGQRAWEARWWPDGDRDRLRAEIAQAAQGAVIRREAEIKGADGRIIPIDLSLKPMRDETTGMVTSIIAECRDLTEKNSLVTQLAQAMKVQALGQLAAGVAHDFNNILQAVSGAAVLIEQQPGEKDRIRHLARTAITAADRGTSIVQRLLSFARRSELRTQAIATAELLNAVREVLERTLGSAITIRTHVPDGIPSFKADQAQLETALINLATNARDAMPDGGTLTLSAEAEHVAEGEHHPANLDPGGYVRLSVGDTGLGMDADTLARVGEPFFTTKPPGQGTGLGLAMVRGFAEQSGGGVSIISTPNAGTTVSLWLRQATDEVRPAADDEYRPPVASGTSARILVVDDDDLVREMVAAQLEAAGFATLVASTGIEALALIEAGEVVDAMVSDLSMPGIDGVTTIQRARTLRPRLPCFLLTGHAGDPAKLSMENDFTLVLKPVRGAILVAQIEAAIEGARV